MIKYTRNFLFNPAQLQVSNIIGDYDNIQRIVKVFNCKLLVMTIDSVSKESELIGLAEKQQLQYFTKPYDNDYTELSIVVPYASFGDFLKKAISEEPENIIIFDLLDPTTVGEQLQLPHKELVIGGNTDVSITIALDENAMMIYMNKSLIRPQEVYKKIKLLNL